MPTLAAELRPLFAGRKVVLTGAPLAALTGLCRRLRDLGAERPFLLATGQGTGEAPGPDEAERYVVELRAPDVMSEIRASMRLLGDLPADVLAALDRWDPERRALVLSPMFNELPQVAGRRVYGPRRPEGRRLEDKVVVDGLWDDLGVTRAPSEVVAAEPEALRAAARRLDRGAGTAGAGDAREGFHGGASLLRWVRDGEDATEAAAFLAARCDRARVMPFLEGVPAASTAWCSPAGWPPVLAAADRSRAGGAWTVTEAASDVTRELPVVFQGGACRPAADGEPAHGGLSFGPSGVGGFVHLDLDPTRVPAGPSVAPLAVAAFAVPTGGSVPPSAPLEPARPVR
jgi:hypothetical protein